MIQRIQSIWLLGAIICSGLLFLMPFFQLIPADGVQTSTYSVTVLKTVAMKTNHQQVIMLNQPLLLLNSVLIILSLITIFSYQKRIRQVQYCNLLLLLFVGLILLIIYSWKQVASLEPFQLNIMPGWGSALVVSSMVCVFMARTYILKDEALVRSADRLR